MRRLALALALAGLGLPVERVASACGCFTPPDPSVPVVQAGERILFAIQDGQVTAQIQIQYDGPAQDFGWILPLPSEPTMELGVDELFTKLTSQTQPKYELKYSYEGNCSFDPSKRAQFATAPSAATGGAEDSTSNGGSPLVYQASVGPYDYAVLKGDSKQPMLDWLSTNHYFVPAGTDETVAQYIHDGAFFLALKLHPGATTGDLQPVVVHYASDLPMIPIVLTSVAAKPNMGIQVWMLGGGRAIPRNYYHTVINDALIDWPNAGQNYNDVIIQAVGEAPGRHSFVTEYAGSSSVMQKQLNPTGRFGTLAELESSANAEAFLQYLTYHGFTYSSALVAILQKYFPEPADLVSQGVSPAQFYGSTYYYDSSYGYLNQNPHAFDSWSFLPMQIGQEIDDRVIQPTLKAGAIFDQFGYLTRLYTTLSPEDMNKDPVFSYNAGLASVSNVHTGALAYHCDDGDRGISNTSATLVTEEGWVIQYPSGTGVAFSAPPGLPASQRIEVLSEEGAPTVVTNNAGVIPKRLGMGGCSFMGDSTNGSLAIFALFGFALAITILRRRSA